MDIRNLLIDRIEFIRQLYATASAPYLERKRLIENEEEPFVPPYSEDGEPAFMSEWMEADDSLHILAYACISMLSAALRLYFETWENYGITKTNINSKSLSKCFKKGYLAGYRAYFEQRLGINLENSPANIQLLEEIILARNVIQHPSSLHEIRARFTNCDLKKIPRPIFVSKYEATMFEHSETETGEWFMPPIVHITDTLLFEAIHEVEKLSEWLDSQIKSKFTARFNQ